MLTKSPLPLFWCEFEDFLGLISYDELACPLMTVWLDTCFRRGRIRFEMKPRMSLIFNITKQKHIVYDLISLMNVIRCRYLSPWS